MIFELCQLEKDEGERDSFDIVFILPILKTAKYALTSSSTCKHFFIFFTFAQHCFRNVAHEQKFQDLFYAYYISLFSLKTHYVKNTLDF